MSAGGLTSCTLTSAGSGKFGGSDLATDGSVITVATGTSTYHIKKANFNLLDYVDVGGTHIVAPSSDANRGLVLTGPTSPNTDCTGGCTNAFSSANDANSTCMIEENGPVKTVLKCLGDLVDGTGHVYLHHTTRLTFWQNKDGRKSSHRTPQRRQQCDGIQPGLQGLLRFRGEVGFGHRRNQSLFVRR